MKAWGLYSFICVFLMAFSGETAKAMTCQQVFTAPQARPARLLPEDHQAVQNYQIARHLLHKASTRTEVIEATYLFAQTANRIIDSIVDNIFILEKSTPPPEVVRALQESSTVMINHLMQTTRIPFKALEKALAQRFELESRELAAMEKQNEERAEYIGYLRMKQESAENLGEKSPRQAIGYLPRPLETATKSSEPLDGEMSVKSQPETGDRMTAANNPRGPIGFRYGTRNEAPESAESHPVGFIIYRDGPLQPSERPQVRLSFESGLFEVMNLDKIFGFRP